MWEVCWRNSQPVKSQFNPKQDKYIHTTSATGATFSEVPMTRSKSTFSRSSRRAWSKLSVSFSPKKVMSGYTSHCPWVQTDELEGRGTCLHNARWKIWLITFIRLGTIPPSSLATFSFFFERWTSGLQWHGIADWTKWNLLALDIILDFGARDPSTTVNAGGCGKWTMTLEDTRYACQRFKGIYVLGIVLQR
jgi:hypothetical protein